MDDSGYDIPAVKDEEKVLLKEKMIMTLKTANWLLMFSKTTMK